MDDLLGIMKVLNSVNQLVEIVSGNFLREAPPLHTKILKQITTLCELQYNIENQNFSSINKVDVVTF